MHFISKDLSKLNTQCRLSGLSDAYRVNHTEPYTFYKREIQTLC